MIDLSEYTEGELVGLLEQVRARLPSLKTLDLQEELVLQFLQAKQLMKLAQDDDEIPLNQKAQLLNSLANMNKQAADLQKSMFSPDQGRLREQALVAALKQYPDLREAFLREFETLLEALC
jgi:hypothetical protein